MLSDEFEEWQSILKRSLLFSALSNQELHRIFDTFKHLSLPKDALLFRKGEPGDSLFLIKSGRVRVIEEDESGERVLEHLGHGDFIGEMQLLTGEFRPASVKLDHSSEFFVLTKAAFDGLLEQNPSIAYHLSKVLAQKLLVASQRNVMNLSRPELYGLLLPISPEERTLFGINLAVALVEQTKKKVLLVDLAEQPGEMARALKLKPLLSSESMLRESDLKDPHVLSKLTLTHPSGLEIISLSTKLLLGRLFPALHAFLNALKENHDYVLITLQGDSSPLSQSILLEADGLLLVTSQNSGSTEHAEALAAEAGKEKKFLRVIQLSDPLSPSSKGAHYRMPWAQDVVEHFRRTGSPFFITPQTLGLQRAMDRLARDIGRLRIGFAMGSGAALGYTLIGMLKIFEKENIYPDIISGTSMGALIGSFYAAGKTPQEIEEIALGVTSAWMKRKILLDLNFPRSGVLAGHEILGFLKSVLGETEFQDLKLPFTCCATDISNGEEVILKEGKVFEAVRASISLPVTFSPFSLGGRFLVDGGLVNPVPTSLISHMGANILISANLTNKPSTRKPLVHQDLITKKLTDLGPNIFEVFFKMIYTMQYEIANARAELSHIVLHPNTRDFVWADFDKAKDIIAIGEECATDALPRIKAMLPVFADYCKAPIRAPGGMIY